LAGRIGTGSRNDDAAITHLRRLSNGDPQQSIVIKSYVELGEALLNQSADNESKASELFKKALNARMHSSFKDYLHFIMGEKYRYLNKRDQSIYQYQSSCVISDKENEAMAQTYLEQYCTDTTLDIHQRNEILKLATEYS